MVVPQNMQGAVDRQAGQLLFDGDAGLYRLNCRLLVCKEDDPEAFYDAGRRARNEEIVGRWQRGEAIPAIAAAHRLSTRSIHRVVAIAREAVAS